MEIEPTSRLTRERPDIWTRGVALFTASTGIAVTPKVPRDGEIFACGGGGVPRPSRPLTPDEQADVDRLKKEQADTITNEPKDWTRYWQIENEIFRIKRGALLSSLAVHVPDGAMEWLLHEMGHWVAATPTERGRPNYGIGQTLWGRDAEQEWQAWAFEDIVLAPWGPARLFAPPEQQDGVGFSKAGPIEQAYLDHAARQMCASGIELGRWRALYAEWVGWERSRLRN